MSNRKQIKAQHEEFLIAEFIKWWDRETGERFKVVKRPDPPDAIIMSNLRMSWIEATDVFYSIEWARNLYSMVTPGETHVPMGREVHVGMDEQTASRFTALLQQKLSKLSYREAFDSYGPGTLIIGMQSPWFDAETYEMMQTVYQNAGRSDNAGYFEKVYLSFRSMNQQVFEEWKYHL